MDPHTILPQHELQHLYKYPNEITFAFNLNNQGQEEMLADILDGMGMLLAERGTSDKSKPSATPFVDVFSIA